MPIRKELRHLYRGEAWEHARRQVRERAGDRCERCRQRNGTVNPGANKYVLIQCGAAHIDHDDLERFYDLSNLAWLCRGCHLRFDMGKHKDSRSTRKDQARPLLQEMRA